LGTVHHHQEHSQHFLDAARRGISGGDYHYAAVALSRSAGHSVTAAAEKSGFPYRSQRRLINFLIDVVCTRRVPLAHLRLFRRIHDLPDAVSRANPETARRLVRQDYRRVVKLVADMDNLIDPNHAHREEPGDMAAQAPHQSPEAFSVPSGGAGVC
jgi:hypothetical protein